ncbi:transcription factor bHLH35 isoform X2 [Populus trichocarpa]|uniref:transcription factor bHLH35 isoform X2 n=1 Tax=Populus trichocarpa TaxID=3694 RepID=UPI0022790168|nr:transcription factor bHLH35 isoform X2 [Populus trichocarpa]
MDIIENIGEYQNYWETSLFWNEELNYSLPEGTASPIRTKNIALETNKRKELNDKLLALREAVPKISKLDKASIIKDAIGYIQDLQEQERILQAEIREHESKRLKKHPDSGFEQELPDLLRSKRTRYDKIYHHSLGRSTCPIQVHELAITSMGENTLLVSLACNKTTDAMTRICEVFESLKLKIITANATVLSGMIKKTVVIEVDEEEKEHLKIKIERAVSALRSPHTVQ